MSSTARARPANRRRSIEDAAADRFATEGFAATGVSDIARDVGITGGAIYRHFSSKEELLETVVCDILTKFCDVADIDPTATGSSPDDLVSQLVANAVELTLTEPSRVATYLRERHRLPEAILENLVANERLLFRRWRTVMAAARPEMSLAEMATRQRAVNGAIASLARRRQSVQRPRLDALIVAGLTGVLLAPIDDEQASTPAPKQRWRRPRSRREEIRDTAVQLFRKHGYHGIGIDQIGEASGIAGPTVYGTYSGKAEILVDAYDQVMAKMSVLTDEALVGAGSAEEALRAAVRAYVQAAFSSADLLAVTSREGRSLPETDRVRMARWTADYRQLWADLLNEVRPGLTEPEARTLTFAAFGLMQRVALGHRRNEPGAAGAEALALAFLLAEPRPIP